MSLKINVNYNIQTILVSESLQQNKPQNSDCVFSKHNLYIMYKKKINSTQKMYKMQQTNIKYCAISPQTHVHQLL